MRSRLLCIALLLGCACASRAEILSPGRDVCWSEPPDPGGFLMASEVIYIHIETADDFVLPANTAITKVRWWGGYFNIATPCVPGFTPAGFFIRFYTSDGCIPDGHNPYAETFIPGSAGETFVGCQDDGYPLYRYEAEVNVPVTGGVRTWLSVQMGEHPFPPDWGRLSAGAITGCDGVVGSDATFQWEWLTTGEVYGVRLDVSQELECGTPVAAQRSSWGRIKGLYR